ncbi:recombinase family protein [Dinghuibacter silviterrae]|uniref:recombinase family protein n=1 Tax=Dinghuibacter silviterrae TaxID=1539049 RepID=UPI001062CA7B|nr:recombinase family protein [Dinghuibacter silviterrae]
MKTENFNAFHSFTRRSKKTVHYVETEFVVTYSRVSTKEQYDKNLSLDTQQKAFDDEARRKGKTILANFGGTYESAKTDGRKEFERMLTYIKKNPGKISQIWVYMTDRFSRTGGGAIKLAEELREKYGVTIYAICQPTDTRDDTGILSQNMQFLFSQYDNTLRRKRAVAGLKAQYEKGIWSTVPPQGYDSVKINTEKKLVVNREGKLIKKAFLWKADGMKNEEIIERLNALGLPMYKQQLTKIFKKPFYCGLIAHGMLDGRIVRGQHEPLISEEIFLRVNNIHQQSPNYGVPHQKENEQLPLKVFVKCGDCGEPFTGYIVRAKGLYYYKCRTTGCKCNKSAKRLHELFEETLERLATKEDLAATIQHRLESFFYEVSKDRLEQQPALKRQLSDIDSKIDSLQEAFFITKEMDRDTYEKFKARYQRERQNIEEKLADCSLVISNLSECIEKAVILSRKLRTVWASSDIGRKEDLQKLVFPEGIHYDRENDAFRTTEMNIIFKLIAELADDPEGIKKGTNYLIDLLSPSAEREGFEPPEV